MKCITCITAHYRNANQTVFLDQAISGQENADATVGQRAGLGRANLKSDWLMKKWHPPALLMLKAQGKLNWHSSTYVKKLYMLDKRSVMTNTPQYLSPVFFLYTSWFWDRFMNKSHVRNRNVTHILTISFLLPTAQQQGYWLCLKERQFITM